MQLWQMLGRKVCNLGRVIDGERNATLGAQKAQQNGSGVGLSVQDELQSFFAETQIKDDKVPQVPVKGTIMSFFARQKQKNPQISSKAPTTIGKDSKTNLSKSLKKPFSLDLKTLKATVEIIEWDCKACTFHNKQPKHASDLMSCEMCGTKDANVIEIDDHDIPSRKVTPGSTRKSQTETYVSTVHQTKPVVSLSKPNIVTIDKVKNQSIYVVPRKLDSSLENPIVLCDDSNDISSPRKKRKLINQSKNVSPIDSNIGGQSSNSATSLSFSVSRNSGRITIHFTESGKSSLTNFKVEEIVTEETVNHLMEARMSRNHNAITAVKLIYDEKALGKGE